MKCKACNGEIIKIPKKSINGAKACYYHCNGCSRTFLVIAGHRYK